MSARRRLTLNADVGERPEALADGSEATLIRLLDWANVACGGHAGDDPSMREVVGLCLENGVQIGAHPGFPDRARFGREVLACSADEVANFVFGQVRALGQVAHQAGGRVRHVKPHGALYNLLVRDRTFAAAIARGAARWSPDLVLVGLAGSSMLDVWREEGFAVAAEAFADRRYEGDGTLRARSFADALLTDPAEAAAQAALVATESCVIAVDGTRVPAVADTICVHSDTPGAFAIADAVRTRLDELRS